MVSSFLVAVGFFAAGKAGHAVPAHVSLVVTVVTTTVVWVTVTYLTRPTDRGALVAFYRLVRPAGPGWGPVRADAGVGPSPDSLPLALLGWVLGCVFVYSALFGAGSFLYGRTPHGLMWLVLFVGSGLGLVRVLPRLESSRAQAGCDGGDPRRPEAGLSHPLPPALAALGVALVVARAR